MRNTISLHPTPRYFGLSPTVGHRAAMWLRVVIGIVAMFGFVATGRCQFDTNQAFALYANRIFFPGANLSGTNVQIKSVAFFGGNVAGNTNANAPVDGRTNKLVVSSFGQPVQTVPRRKPDYNLGDPIVPPPSVNFAIAPTFNNGNAFFVTNANQVYANGSGLVTVTWSLNGGGSTNITYFVSGTTTNATQSIYWTDAGPINNPTNTGAPTVYLNSLNVIVHNNFAVPAGSAFLSGGQLHARDNSGTITLEYHDNSSNSTFLGLQLVQVKPYDAPLTYSDVGKFLSPVVSNVNFSRPIVSRGLSNSPVPYNPAFAYQHNAAGDPRDGAIFLTQPTTPIGNIPSNAAVEVFWNQTGSNGIVWPYEMDRYKADWPANFNSIAQRIYWTHRPDDSATTAPQVNFPANVPNIVIHYNANVPPDAVNSNGVHSTFWQQNRALYAKQGGAQGRVLLHYDDGSSVVNGQGFIGIEYVDVRPYAPDFIDDHAIGDPLSPSSSVISGSIASQPDTVVTHGILNAPEDPNNPNFVYQHAVSGPMQGEVFAVKTNQVPGSVEVFFRQFGQQGILWPYEQHWYLAHWPGATESNRYQIYVRGDPPETNLDVVIPSTILATLMPYQQPGTGVANQVTNGSFTTSGSGYSLLKYTSGALVDFQVVLSVLHNDSSYFNLSPSNQNIGTEIWNNYHQGPRAGYIFVPTNSPHAWDRYDWQIYDGDTSHPEIGVTKQIFGVNDGSTLEVWWSNLKTNLNLGPGAPGIQWPSMVNRYANRWGSYSDTIVIASQAGTGLIDTGKYQNFGLYVQNDSGKAGFNPNDEHASIQEGAIYALRCDLTNFSQPYVLMRYQNISNLWAYKIYPVVAQQPGTVFNYYLTARDQINPPFPLSVLPPGVPTNNQVVAGPYFRDRNHNYWAKQACDDGISTTNVVMQFYYPVQSGYYFPDANAPNASNNTGGTNVGAIVAWLDRLPGGHLGTPVNVTNTISWPADPPLLHMAETEVGSRPDQNNAADIGSQKSVEIPYQQGLALGQGSNVVLIDPTRIRLVPLLQLPPDATTQSDPITGQIYFPTLPPQLRSRLWFDPTAHTLNLKGQYVVPPAGEYYLLLDILTPRELPLVQNLSSNKVNTFENAVNSLGALSLIPLTNDVPFAGPIALTAGLATNSGWVTLVFNNSTNLALNQPGDPIGLEVLYVTCSNYNGDLKVITSDNPFDQNVTMRHSGDFAGKAENYNFQWMRAAPVNGMVPGGNGPPNTNLYESYVEGPGIVDITVGPAGSSGIDILSDHYFICRYQPIANGPCGTNWSAWTLPQLQEGWLKRVLAAINPFNQRDTDYGSTQVNTIVSMIGQAGPRWTGNAPLNQSAANSFGLIQIYETLFNQALALTASGGPPGGYGPANDAILDVTTRLADLYMLLGNEAYAEASDPTIGFGTDDKQYGDVATSIHCFDNQTASRLEEELDLMRGRDNSLEPDVSTAPVYNRLVWNFSGSVGEAAYVLNYNLTDVTGPNGVPDGVIDAYDGAYFYPQGHGDAWGHYLTAIKRYYDLLHSTNFTWVPRIESVLIGGVPVSVDYYDERKFAQAAAAKAKTGAEIVNLTYRSAYVEDPQGQWQGYTDTDTNRAWGVAEWGSRAGQGSYFDWIVANAILPAQYQAGYKMTQNTLDAVGNNSVYTLSLDGITNGIARAAVGISSNALAELTSAMVGTFIGRSNFLSDLDSVIGAANEEQFRTAILAVAQTNGMPESAYELLDLLKGHVYPTTNALQAALMDTNVLGPTLFNQYYSTQIGPNLEVPTGGPVTGIQEVDRSTVSELADIASDYLDIQQQVDNADMGLNPLGLVKNAIPFDIDPTLVSQGTTHFDQIYNRAVEAMNNAIVTFNNAYNSTQLLRQQADSLNTFQQSVQQQENTFTNQLIEVFGYPYPEDIGAGGTYPQGYQGPDTEAFHYNYVDTDLLTGTVLPASTAVTQTFTTVTNDAHGGLIRTPTNLTFNLAANDLAFVKPTGWSQRRATGTIQQAIGNLLQAQVNFQRSLATYDNLIAQIEDQASLIQAQFNIDATEVTILNTGLQTQITLDDQIKNSRQDELSFRELANAASQIANASAEMLPTDFGTADDTTAPLRGAIQLAGAITSDVGTAKADTLSLAQLDYQQAQQESQSLTSLEVTTLNQQLPVLQALAQLEQLIRQEVLLRLDVYTQQQAIQQAAGNYSSTLAGGQRILQDRLVFRQKTAAQIQGYRYKDMSFRMFRNDALQQYRSQFDLAAKYVYLAARTYDYETNLRTNDSRGPGDEFMTSIIRARSLGLIQNGVPVASTGIGDPGLADPMAKMKSDWDLVLKGQLGFNNPETETGRFSLRAEKFRVQTNANVVAANAAWKEVLTGYVVSNILDMPEFQQYCIPFTPSQPVEPGIVIPFSTTINFGQNFFLWPLGGGDNSYDSSHFATKIRSVGVWFDNYNNGSSGLANEPRVYLIPIGNDTMTSPPRFQGDSPFMRQWKITDQELPVPFPLSQADLADQTYIPINDSLLGAYGNIRKYASFRAYQDAGNFDPSQTITASRLIGRSVWNDRWLLIIPAGTLLSDRNEAIQQFINGQLLPDGTRDGNGVTDIKIFFQTYSYSGN